MPNIVIFKILFVIGVILVFISITIAVWNNIDSNGSEEGDTNSLNTPAQKSDSFRYPVVYAPFTLGLILIFSSFIYETF